MDALERSLIGIQKFREELPEGVNAYLNYSSKIRQGSALDEKQKSLITISLSLLTKCEMCISMNVGSARELGVTKEEILEASMLAVAMGGGPIMMYMKFVLEELDLMPE